MNKCISGTWHVITIGCGCEGGCGVSTVSCGSLASPKCRARGLKCCLFMFVHHSFLGTLNWHSECTSKGHGEASRLPLAIKYNYICNFTYTYTIHPPRMRLTK